MIDCNQRYRKGAAAMRRPIHFIFNYGDGTITIKDNYYTGERSWRVPSSAFYKNDVDNGLYMIDVHSSNPKTFKKYKPTLPLAIMHTMLALCYNNPSGSYGTYVDLGHEFGLDNRLIDKKRGSLEEITSTAVKHLNDTFDNYFNNIFHIERKTVSANQHLYRFNPLTFDTEIEISWEHQFLSEYVIEDFNIDRSWVREESESIGTRVDPPIVSDEHISARKTIPISSATQKSIWKDAELKQLAKTYKEHLIDCDYNLLPIVKVVNTDCGTLPDFICGRYIKLNLEIEKGRSFVIIDGPMGSGKSYSLYETARRLAADGHYVVAFDLPEVYSYRGTDSLLKHICSYISGNDSEPEELRLRSLLEYDARSARDDKKTVFIIDGIDETSSLKYRDFASELSKIARTANPNVIFILGTRNADDFLKNSGITEERSVFKRWVNVSMKEIDYEAPMFNDEKELQSLMENNRIFRTPLFVSYYREIQALAKGAETDGTRFLGSYGQEIDIDKIRTFHNYYDLFYARTELLCAHARKNNISPAWYSAVLPCLAYYLHTSYKRTEAEQNDDEREFGYSDIERIFESSEGGPEFEWFNRAFNEEYGAFRNLFPEEKLNQLLGTRIVMTVPGTSDKFRFEHEEYKYFLAALFASRVIRRTDKEEVRNVVLKKINEKTSLYSKNRYGKMLYIPFARYAFMDVVKNKPLISDAITGSRRGRKPKNSYDNFDPVLYQIAANVSYEDRDVYDEAAELTEEFFKYQEERHTNRSETTIIKAFEDWKMVNDVNVIDYSMITRRNEDPDKWKMLGTIEEDLKKCATIVLRDAFEEIEGSKQVAFVQRGFARNFPLSQEVLLTYVNDLEEYIRESERPVIRLGRFPVDFLGKLISNIGATKQEMAKYLKNKRKNRDAAIDKLYEAVDFHKHALEFRNAVVERIDEYLDDSQYFELERKDREDGYLKELERVRMNISTIRSLITLGTDYYYMGDYEAPNEDEKPAADMNPGEAYENAKALLEQAVEDYHNQALVIQGVAPLKELSYDMSFPVERLSIEETPQVGAEPFVIFRRAAGAYYLLYEKTLDEIKRLGVRGEQIAAANLKKYAEELIRKQYIYLKGTYIYLFEACYSPDDKVNAYKPDRIRLEINSKEIDGMWADASKKFIKTLPGKFVSDDGKDEGKDLLIRILNMYKELHPLSNETISFVKEVK